MQDVPAQPSVSFFDRIQHWFFPPPAKTSEYPFFSCTFPQIESSLFHLLIKKITHDGFVQEWTKKYEDAHQKIGQDREISLIKLYLQMEQFFTTQKFPIIDHQYTIDELRGSIARDCPIRSLGEAFQLLFIPSNERLLLMFDIATRDIFHYLIENLGLSEFSVLLQKSLTSTVLAPTILSPQGIQWNTSTPKEAILPIELAYACKTLSTACYDTIYTSFGESIAHHLFEQPYAFIYTTYGAAFSKEFFSTLPERIADSILLSILTREELEQRLTDATKKESQRREMAESLVTKLKQKDAQLEAQKATIEKKIEERTMQLQQQRDRMDASINSLSIGFILTDKTPEVIMINSAAKRMLLGKRGVNADALSWAYRTIRWQDVIATIGKDVDIDMLIKQCITEAKPSKIPPFSFHDRFITLQLTPIASRLDEKNNISIIGTVILMEDVTEAQSLERTRDEFFSIASHELRTPLTAIRGDTSIILQYLGDEIANPTVKTLINDIHDASIRLIQIVNDFLSVSRLEQKRIEFISESFDMSELVKNVITELNTQIQEKHLLVEMRPPSCLTTVYADKTKTKEVVINLLSNAIKYTDQGSVSIDFSQEENTLNTRVKDTGKGIPKEQTQLVFRKFQQASNNILTRDNSRSTGLGLYISKLLVEGMKGQIKLEESTEGKGSTFCFTLPIAKPQSSPSL